MSDRGAGDYLYSQDIDDIIQVVDARAELASELHAAEYELHSYVSQGFRSLLETRAFLDSISAHLNPDAAGQARETLILKRMRKMTTLGGKPG
jgi:hypothetical protein